MDFIWQSLQQFYTDIVILTSNMLRRTAVNYIKLSGNGKKSGLCYRFGGLLSNGRCQSTEKPSNGKGITRFQPNTIGKVFSWESTIKTASFKSLTRGERGNCVSLQFRAYASILPTLLPLAEIGKNSRSTHAVHTTS